MWRNALLLGLLLAVIVFAAGYGQVLLFRLILRSTLVGLGTVLTIIAANKAITVFVEPDGSGTIPPQVNEVDLGNLDEVEDEGEQTPEEQPTGEETEMPEDVDDIEDESEIEELADMVSDTMKEDEDEEL